MAPLFALLTALACPAQAQTLEAAADAVERAYFNAAQGAQIAADIRRWSAAGRYADDCANPLVFAQRFERDLDVHDGHFQARLSRPDGPAGQWLSDWRAAGQAANAGVREVRLLDPGIGYLRLSAFYAPDQAEPKLHAALLLLQDARGLVLDLRQNGGGDSDTADLLLSSLIGAETTSVQSVETRSGLTSQTLPTTSLPRFPSNRPIAVLVDRRTGSAAEFLAYSLQTERRAVVIGSRTGGAAHMIGEPTPLPNGLSITIPNGRPVNHKTRDNWEGPGVTPDQDGGDDPLHVARRWIEAQDVVDQGAR